MEQREEKGERKKERMKSAEGRKPPWAAGVQPRWIQGIRSGDGVGEIRKQLLN